MASEFEAELKTLDARLEKAQKTAEALVSGLKRVRRAARFGQVSEIVKGLEGHDAGISDAQSEARELSSAWNFDVSSYMADGRFLADLKAAAAEQNLAMFERDDRIYSFPLILRVDSNQSAVRVGKKMERRIRPSELARLLAQAQKRPQRFRVEAFLDLVWRTYRRLLGREWNGTDAGRVVALIRLAAPDEAALSAAQERIANLYFDAYHWRPPVSAIGEIRAGKSMRQYIKSWIVEWDVERLYGESPAIEAETIRTDYSESAELEQAPASGEGDEP